LAEPATTASAVALPALASQIVGFLPNHQVGVGAPASSSEIH
jgi:hypothetical protein